MTTIDTIVATATAPGMGAVAVLRMSGTDAVRIARALVRPRSLPLPGSTGLRWVTDPGTEERVDQVVVSVHLGPRSYTGEDVVELSGHGGPLAPSMLLAACIAAGARQAEPGEFTRRAFLNGKIDLVQAEAVLDLIDGRSPALHRAALGQLDGSLSGRLEALRARLVELEALLVHHIDFPDEDDPPVPIERIVAVGADVAEALERMLATAPEGELLRDGALTVLAGPPNSGKSTLFNALVGRDRAIVTEHPGTTRDAIEARVPIGGYPFVLVDTAGMRAGAGGIERMGIEVAERYLADADLVIFCDAGADAGADVETDGEPEASLRAGAASVEHLPVREFLAGLRAPVLPVRTKIDMPRRGSDGGSAPQFWDGDGSGGILPPVAVSAHTGEGLAELRATLPRLIFAGLVSANEPDSLLTRRRHVDGVGTAAEEVRAFIRALADGVPAEVASTHLRPAETALESLLGVIPHDEVLDAVFREFCIGK